MENDESSSSSNNQLSNLRTLTSLYSNHFRNRISSFLPISSDSSFVAKIASFCRQFCRARSRRRKPCLPLPLPSKSLHSSLIMTEASRIFEVLEDILEQLFSNMHYVQKNLHYWQIKEEGSNAQKAYFMLFQRGPQALVSESLELVRNFIAEDSSFQILCHNASDFIAERVNILDSLKRMLAKFLAQVYMMIDKQGEDLMSDPHRSLPSLLVTIDGLFSDLETSISKKLNASTSQVDSSSVDSKSIPLVFNKITEREREVPEWTDDEIREAIVSIYQNLQKLDSYLSDIVGKYRKPRKMTRQWVRYTCGAVGLSVCSLWLVRHSRLVGSPDIDNWICEAKESTISFWTEHVEQPILSIRDELFDTFRKRHKGVMDSEEVQLTANSLRRMLLAFCEQTNGKQFPENAADQELLEIVMSRYEKELMHPIKSLFGGELPRAMLIQVQKLKLDIETAMLELDQILKANEINFAVLAALPAFIFIVILIMFLRSWIKQDKGAEGRGRLARRQRRLLIVEIEKMIMQYQSCMDLRQIDDAQCCFGLVLYTLDHLYRAVQNHAKTTGEWSFLKQDIIDLAKPELLTTHKLIITSRMERVYDCLLPSIGR